jgi:hypothetical protein
MLWQSARKVLRRSIPRHVYNEILPIFIYYYKKITFGTETFQFRGHTYSYFCHIYNQTWRNERAVEVPIIWNIVRNCHGRVLEVGNVLSHYYPIAHDVVDKYERAKNVLNADIANFRPQKPYDLVVSISTLEHVGWDDEPQDPEKINFALENLKMNCMAPGGMMVITCPLGYNPDLGRLLDEKRDQLGEKHFLKRAAEGNNWTETTWDDVRNAKYNYRVPCADAIVIGSFCKE